MNKQHFENSSEGMHSEHSTPSPSLFHTKNVYSWVEISRSAFTHNIAAYKDLIGPQVALALVIKGNGYGHGLREVACLAEKNKNVAYFCVAHLEEAAELRTYGITKPILVLSKVYADFDYAAEFSIDLMVDDHAMLEKINRAAKKIKKKVNIHIKVDIGLSRFGCSVEQLPSLIEYAHASPNINLVGIYSHFSESHKSDSSITQHQKQFFFSVLERYAAYIPMRHIANSVAVVAAQHPLITMVRIGAGAYGLVTPQAINRIHLKIKQVISWKTRIIEIKKISTNRFVGYDSTFKTDRDTILAIIPVGYYDGYKKELSNKASVLVNNCYAPVRGLVGMNHTTIDITDISHTKIGDVVTLLSDTPEITAQTLANYAHCFNPRQMTTSINPLLKRIIGA